MVTPPTLVVVAGPTAVGKTSHSIQLAQRLNAEIISADSRQFYRGMNIGTAKATPAERAAVKHHFIDWLDVTTPYTAGQFEAEVLAFLDHEFSERPVWILTGGSGLYLRAVCDGMDAFPEVPEGIRAGLEQRLREEGIKALQEQLLALDPVYHKQVDLSNPQRLIRALEVCLASGKPYSSFRTSTPHARPFRILKYCLELPREALYDRINQRVLAMMEAGLLEEVRSLLPHRHCNALQTVGYQELFAHLDGAVSLDEAVANIQQNSRRFAKRQLTWFRKDPAYQWFSAADSEQWISAVENDLSTAS